MSLLFHCRLLNGQFSVHWPIKIGFNIKIHLFLLEFTNNKLILLAFTLYKYVKNKQKTLTDRSAGNCDRLWQRCSSNCQLSFKFTNNIYIQLASSDFNSDIMVQSTKPRTRWYLLSVTFGSLTHNFIRFLHLEWLQYSQLLILCFRK